eukprot:UN4752
MTALLRFGANPSKVDAQGATCAALACSEGHLELLRKLAQGISWPCRTYSSALCGAVRCMSPRSSAPRPDSWNRAFCAMRPSNVHRAVACGHLDIVHYLISARGGEGRENACTIEASASADVGVSESWLEAPLHTAVLRLSNPPKNLGYKPRRYEMMELLLELGADPTLQDRHGDTPLHLCARQHDLHGLWVLLVEVPNVGAATRKVNSDGCTFLDEAKVLATRIQLLAGAARLMPRSVR